MGRLIGKCRQIIGNENCGQYTKTKVISYKYQPHANEGKLSKFRQRFKQKMIANKKHLVNLKSVNISVGIYLNK